MTRAEVLLAAAATIAAAAYFEPFVGYWDGYDYLACMVEGRPSGLLLGRPCFVFLGWLVAKAWAACGGSLETVHVPVKLLVFACAAPFVVVAHRLFLVLGVGPVVARRAALLLAASPVLASMTSQVLTEPPMLLVGYVGLLWWARGYAANSLSRVALGGALVGVAFGFREQAVLLLPLALALALLAPSRRVLLTVVGGAACALTAGAPPAWLAISDPAYVANARDWLDVMSRERGLHPLGADQAAIWFTWLVASQPIAVWFGPAGMVRLVRFARRTAVARPGAVFAGVSLVLLALFGTFQDLVHSPRYLLFGAPGLAVAGAIGLEPWARRLGAVRFDRGFSLALCATLVVGYAVQHDERRLHHKAGGYAMATLDRMPRGAVLIVGQLAPLVHYLEAARGDPGRWELIEPGWAWPRGRLGAVIDAHLALDRAVYIDLDPLTWLGARMHEELAEWATVRERYRVERAEGGLFRVRSGT